MASDPQTLIKVSLVVINNIDPRELSENLDEDSEDDSLSVAWFHEELLKAFDRNAVLESDLITHLRKFGLEEGFIFHLTVKPLQNGIGFVVAFILQKPTWGEGKPETSCQEDDGRHTL